MKMMNRTYIVNRLSEKHFQDLMNLYNEASWTKTRTSDEVREMIDNSYIFGDLRANVKQSA
jgi:hypothetical protein